MRCSPTLDARGKAAALRAKQLTDDLSKFLQPQWYQARERLDDARVRRTIESKLAALAAEVQAKDLAQQLADYEIGINVTKLDRLNDLHTAWQRRYAAGQLRRISASEAAEWLDETKAASERLRVDAATLHAKAESVQKQLDAHRKETARGRQGRHVAPLLARQDRANRSSRSGDSAKRRSPSSSRPAASSTSCSRTI